MMHWVLQENIHQEWGMSRLIEVLLRERYTFSVHKVIPFVGEITPDISPANPVICIGSYSMGRVAKKKNWYPGIFSLDHVTFQMMKDHWGEHLLNADGVVTDFIDVSTSLNQFFIRPESDAKLFGGKVIGYEEYMTWCSEIMRSENGICKETGLRCDTPVITAAPKKIFRENRFWIVGGEVVTYSQYKIGDRVAHDANVDQDIIEFAIARVEEWEPCPAFVLDIALTPTGCKVIELNCINFAGFYAANIDNLVYALVTR